MNKILTNLLLIIIIAITQISILSSWRYPLNNLNLVLVLIIFITVIINYKKGLWWAFGAGLFLELFSNLIFGTITLALISNVILLNLLFSNFFTNKSIYSLIILGFFSTIFYNLMIIFGESINILLKISQPVLPLNLKYLYQTIWWQLFLNLIALIIIFLVFNTLTKKLKSTFLTNH